MQLNSQEHIDMMKQFEIEFSISSFRGRLDKEDKSIWSKGNIYQDGIVNELFLIYRKGYSFGRCVYLNA